MNTRLQVLAVLAAGVVAGVPLVATPQGRPPVQRTLYVTATDAQGSHVADLSPADLTVKEGREREIVRVQPSGERLRIAIAVDELLAPDGTVRQSTLRFIQRLRVAGDLALHLIGQRSETRVEYTSEYYPFLNAINAFPARAQYPGNLVQSLLVIAREQRPLEGRRAIVVIAPEIPQISSVTAEGVFDQLRDGGTVLYAATFVGWRTSGGTLQEQPATRLEGGDMTQVVERDRVLGDGPKRSGGLLFPSLRVEGLQAALDRIADDLLHQFRVTYILPPGTRSDGRVSVSAKRKGLTVRGPSRLPEM